MDEPKAPPPRPRRPSTAPVGRALESVLRLPGLVRGLDHQSHYVPGSPPGVEHIRPELDPTPVTLRLIDYSKDRVESSRPASLDALLAIPMPDWVTVRWVNVDGLSAEVVKRLRDAYRFHSLAAEDVLHVPQRPRVEPYDDHLFVVLRMVTLTDAHLASEQVSIFLWERCVLSFQESEGDIFDPIRQRIDDPASRLREKRADFLLYSLLDSVVDHTFPLLEHYGDALERLEDVALADPSPRVLGEIQSVRRELVSLRRVIWPTRELVHQLQQPDIKLLHKNTRIYLRDVYTHAVQALDVLESYREMVASLVDIHMSVLSNRMNEVMKVLSLIGTVFIPITFIAGVYGMNFDHFPELHHPYAYPAFWIVCGAIVTSLLIYFRRRRWI